MECITMLKSTLGESLSALKVGTILIVIPASVNIAVFNNELILDINQVL